MLLSYVSLNRGRKNNLRRARNLSPNLRAEVGQSQMLLLTGATPLLMESTAVTDTTHEELLGRSRTGDQEALMRLLFQFHQPLVAYIQSNLSDRLARTVSTDDLLQETFVSAMRGIEKQEGNTPAQFLTWLRSIASNRLKDAARAGNAKKRGGDHVQMQSQPNPFRSQAGNFLDELAVDSLTASRVVGRREAVDAMQVAMSALPEEQREALRLHCFEQLSIEQTAAAMGKTTGSIRGLIQRAKEHLRVQMDQASKWLSG